MPALALTSPPNLIALACPIALAYTIALAASTSAIAVTYIGTTSLRFCFFLS